MDSRSPGSPKGLSPSPGDERPAAPTENKNPTLPALEAKTGWGIDKHQFAQSYENSIFIAEERKILQ
jgi:hypothetical protein